MRGRTDGFGQGEQLKGTVVLRLSEVEFRAAMLRHEEIKREAELLGPLRYELRQQRALQGPGKAERFRVFAKGQASAFGSFAASSLPIRSLAGRLPVR